MLGYADGIDLMVEKRKGLKALSEKSLTEVSQGKAHKPCHKRMFVKERLISPVISGCLSMKIRQSVHLNMLRI